MSTNYSHEGTITKIDNNIVTVTICAASACSSCHAKGACSGLDHSMKNIEVSTDQQFQIGEQVMVSISQRNSLKALTLGYILPIISLIVTLVVINLLGLSEIIMALSSLGVLAFYYLILYLFKDSLKKEFGFVIERKS